MLRRTTFFFWGIKTTPAFETSAFKPGEVALLGKGAKVAPLTSNGTALKWTPGSLQVLFQPKAFNDPNASRVSVCFSSNDEI